VLYGSNSAFDRRKRSCRLTALTDTVGQLGGWLDRIAKRQDRADAAVKAVLLALNETQGYIADCNAGNRSRMHEALLVRLWTDAAVAIRRKYPDVAQRLQMKAEYWTDPERWTAVDVERAGIRIKEVAAQARAFLGGAL
jgi:hypothetical protein